MFHRANDRKDQGPISARIYIRDYGVRSNFQRHLPLLMLVKVRRFLA